MKFAFQMKTIHIFQLRIYSALLISLLFLVSCTSSTGQRQEPPLLVGRGERMIILRMPSSEEDTLVDITFYSNNPALNVPRLVDIIPANYSSLKEYTVTGIQLDEDDWSKAEKIRIQWCNQQESRPKEANNEQTIMIGIKCGDATVVFSTSIANQTKELHELTQLIPARTNENTYTVPNINYP